VPLVPPLKDNEDAGYEEPINVNVDTLAARGFFPQNHLSYDENAGLERDASGNLTLKDGAVAVRTLTQVYTEAVHTTVAGEIAGVTEKSPVAPADLLLIEDSAAANAKKRARVSRLRHVIQTQHATVTTDTTTTSSSFVTLLSVTINVTHANNRLVIHAAGSLGHSNANVTVRFRILVDGVSIGGGSARTPGASNNYVTMALARVTGPLTAGNHTVTLQWLTPSGTVRVRPVANVDNESATLLAQEINA
jgi:hypothetical protein